MNTYTYRNIYYFVVIPNSYCKYIQNTPDFKLVKQF